MKTKVTILGLVLVILIGVFATLSSVESYDTDVAPDPVPAAVEPPCEPGQDHISCPGEIGYYQVRLPIVFKPVERNRMEDLDPACHWKDISKPPPKCWCELLPWEPPDYIPMGCPGR